MRPDGHPGRTPNREKPLDGPNGPGVSWPHVERRNRRIRNRLRKIESTVIADNA